MAITSQRHRTVGVGDVWIGQWQAAGLLKPSAIKPVFATLEQALIMRQLMRQLGKLAAADQATLKRAIAETLG
jgi:mRNA interferase MazF